jgi:hypoxanthine phosphoribosyltransferase
MNWQEFEEEIRNLNSKINYKPDYIVGIVRGGLIPSRMLAKVMKIKPMFCLSVEKRDNERVVISGVDYPLEGKKILLVEDMLETGKSLMVAKKWLEKKGAEVKTACLLLS